MNRLALRKTVLRAAAALSALWLIAGAGSLRAQTAPTSSASVSPAAREQPAPGAKIHTKASWYGPGLAGKETSTGETFDPHKLTAASSKLPLGSTAEVENLENGSRVTVKINDCGPYVDGRKMDVSSRAADKLKMKQSGVVPVEVKLLHRPADPRLCTTE
jgi:rare lipoprotein A